MLKFKESFDNLDVAITDLSNAIQKDVSPVFEKIYEVMNKLKKQPKIKTHVLWVSPRFPHDHPRAGEATYFVDKIAIALSLALINENADNFSAKLHTCRADSKNSKNKKGAYEEWKRKIDEVNAGKAILSLRMWSGSPYNSKHDGSQPVEIAQFNKDSGIGVQKLEFTEGCICSFCSIDGRETKIVNVAINDGLSWSSFKAWFRKADLSKPIAIIQLTKFRY